MKMQKGVVLLIVLLFISLFSLMSLHTLSMAALSHKNNRYDWDRIFMLMSAEILMSKISISSSSICKWASNESVVNKPFSWWKKSGCADKVAGLECYHVVQALGQDPCAYTKRIDNHLVIADYYKITLLCWTGEIEDSKLLLQSTVIKDGSTSSTCSGISRQVRLGKQVLRQIYSN